MASESMSDDTSELGGGEMEGMALPVSSASSLSNDLTSELAAALSEMEDSNSCMEPSSSETDSYGGTGYKVKDDASCVSSSSDLTVASTSREQNEDPSSSASSSRACRVPARPGILWRKGERLEAQDYQHNWYTSKIMSVDEEKKLVKIHFEGWNQRYDEMLSMESDRLRPLTRHSERWEKHRKKGKTIFKVGDQVLAKWTDCKMYLAKIDELREDGSYMVLFYDGIKKNIQPMNLCPVPARHKQKFQMKPAVISPKDPKNIKPKPVEVKGNPSSSAATDKPKVAKSSSSSLSLAQTSTALKRKKMIVSGSLFFKGIKTEKGGGEEEKEGEEKKSEGEGLKMKLKLKVLQEETPSTTASTTEPHLIKTEDEAAAIKTEKQEGTKTVDGEGGKEGPKVEATATIVKVKAEVKAEGGAPIVEAAEAGSQTYVAAVTGIVPKKIVSRKKSLLHN